MATSTRIKGNVNPYFQLKLGSAAAVSFADDLKATGLEYEERDSSDQTFLESSTGGSQGTFTGTAVVSMDAGSLFAFLTDNPGATATLTWGPLGNATPAATKWHYKGDVTLGLPPNFSLEASTDGVGAEFEFEWKFNGPVQVLKS